MIYPLEGQPDALPEQVEAALGLGQGLKVLDVRTIPEYAARHIPGAILVPLDSLAGRLDRLDPDEHWVVVCEHGIRSRSASEFLRQQGYEHITNMVGGMSRWTGPVENGGPPR